MYALQSNTDSTTVETTFLDAAAALEQELHNTRMCARDFEQRLRLEQQAGNESFYRQERFQILVVKWIKAIRHCHGHRPPATTGRLIRAALKSLTSDEPTRVPLY